LLAAAAGVGHFHWEHRRIVLQLFASASDLTTFLHQVSLIQRVTSFSLKL